MKRSVVMLDGSTRIEEATPKCGEDFCDRCGDCLACFGEDPCVDGHREHLWVVYEADFTPKE
jgi:hypothetical protein